jgi:hypothetical protein
MIAMRKVGLEEGTRRFRSTVIAGDAGKGDVDAF